MRNTIPTIEEACALGARVHDKFRAVWHDRPHDEQAALARYFLPHSSRKEVLEPSRPRVIKWYCPFAHQHDFPSGHRYCINVYTGCAHRCVYCYAAAYAPDVAANKRDFARLLAKDLDDLERFDVPPAPLHLSNSTDPFQSLEEEFGHTRHALEQVLRYRHRFTTITILTKNPLLPVQRGYVDLLRALATLPPDHPRHDDFEQGALPGFVLAASLAFWRDTARAVYDPGAPTVEERVEGLRALHAAGIPLVLRIDPLFPRSPLADGRTLEDFGLPEAQTNDDLDHLVALARELNVRHVVYSPTKIVQPRGRRLQPLMLALRDVYRALAGPEKLDFHGGSWRLPDCSCAEAHNSAVPGCLRAPGRHRQVLQAGPDRGAVTDGDL